MPNACACICVTKQDNDDLVITDDNTVALATIAINVEKSTTSAVEAAASAMDAEDSAKAAAASALASEASANAAAISAANAAASEATTSTNLAIITTTLKDYADTKDTIILDNAKSYANMQDDENLAIAKLYTDTEIASVVNSAPTALNTLKKIANAIDDDPNFATTITALIATKADQSTTYSKNEIDINLALKAPLDSPALTGTPSINGLSPVVTTDSRLSDARVPIAHNQSWSTITDTPTLVEDYGITDVYNKTQVNTLDAATLTSAKSYTDIKVAALVSSAPATLDTLNELAEALGNDPNFATTMTTLIGTKASQDTTYTKDEVDTSLGLKAPIASPAFTGNVKLPATTTIGNVSATEIGYLDGVTSAIQIQIDTKAPIESPTFASNVTSPIFTSTIANGTAPLAVVSTTKVTNLNADRVDGYDAGNANGNVPVSNGTLNTNLNADMLDGYHAGNIPGQIPVNNGVLNTNLNAEKVGGHTFNDIEGIAFLYSLIF